MIRTPLPQAASPLHTVITHQNIDQRTLEGMTHVQAAGNVGRGQHDTVRGPLAAGRIVS